MTVTDEMRRAADILEAVSTLYGWQDPARGEWSATQLRYEAAILDKLSVVSASVEDLHNRMFVGNGTPAYTTRLDRLEQVQRRHSKHSKHTHTELTRMPTDHQSTDLP